MRRKVVAANWKMNKKIFEGCEFLEDIHKELEDVRVEVVICPPMTSLSEFSVLIEEMESELMLGAQNMHFEESGAYTGEVSSSMLSEIGVTHVIIVHSERRQYFNETDETVNKKLAKALSSQIVPIVCVGETLEERQNGTTAEVIERQITAAYNGISKSDAMNTIVAYEPIWAIGTGMTATTVQAEEVCKLIRDLLERLYDSSVSEEVAILYGGSVKASNASELFDMPDIDGALVGGASLTTEFVEIVKAALSKCGGLNE